MMCIPEKPDEELRDFLMDLMTRHLAVLDNTRIAEHEKEKVANNHPQGKLRLTSIFIMFMRIGGEIKDERDWWYKHQYPPIVDPDPWNVLDD